MNDPGLTALATVYRALGVEDEWTQSSARAFRWFGADIPITVEAGPVQMVQGDPTSRITAVVPISSNLTASRAEVEIACAMNNFYGTVGSMTLATPGPVVVSRISHNHYVDNEDNLAVFGDLCKLLYAESVQRASELGPKLGVIPVVASGGLAHRSQPAPIFGSIASAVQDRPARNPFVGIEIEALPDLIRQIWPPSTPMGGGEHLSAQLFINPLAATRHAASLLLTVAATEHPHFGPGLQVILKVPLSDDLSPMTSALLLNMAEHNAGPDTVAGCGAWTIPPEDNMIAHTQFLPHFVYRPGLVDAAVAYDLNRVGWALDNLASQWEDEQTA